MEIVVLGVSHHTAPLPVRERIAYSQDEAIAALQSLKHDGVAAQAMLVSTCNRTELYAVAPHEKRIGDMTRRIFEDRIGSAAPDSQWLYRFEDKVAVEHLFRVVCGLDSMMLGEQQILGQVKTAYDVSRRADTTGAVLHRLASRAFRVGKRARAETRIGEGAVSVAFAAVELAQKVFDPIAGRGVLVVGAGDNARLCVEHLLARRCRPLIIANRTMARAEELAQEYGGETVALTELSDAMTRADIVVSTTGSPDLVVTADMVRSAMARRGDRSMVLVDIAVPRDVAEDVDEIRNVFRFDMDALQDIVDQNVSRREKEVPAVEKMVENETQNFIRWWRGLAASPIIRELHEAFEHVRQEEMDRHGKRFKNEDREQLDIFTRNLIRKLLIGVTTEIKGYRPENPREGERLAALRHLFHLSDAERDHDEDKGLE